MKQPLALEASILDLFRTTVEGFFWLSVMFLVGVGVFAFVNAVWLAFAVIMLTLAFLFYTGYIEPRWYETKVYRLTLREGVFIPLKIIFLSDFHTGHRKSKSRYTKLFRKVQALQPDLILLGGDFVESIGRTADDLQGIELLTPAHGMYFVLGNHDYWDDPMRVASALQRFGAQDLTNQTKLITIGDQQIQLLGLDDASFGTPRLPTNWHKELPTILLTHEVDLLSDFPEGTADLIFLGHTHGGQVRLPFKGSLAPLPQAAPAWLDQGLKAWRGMRLLISRGTGESTIRFRFWARPQIVVVEFDK